MKISVPAIAALATTGQIAVDAPNFSVTDR